MKKLVFICFVVLLGMGFVACEQENIEPTQVIELNQAADPGSHDGDEDGDRPIKN